MPATKLSTIFASALLLLTSFGPALAQEQPPAPEITRLIDLLEGSWDTAVTYEPNDAMPEGGSAQGTEVSRIGPGGHSVVFETASQGSGGTFEAVGIITWSVDEQAYKLYWFPSTDPAGAFFTGEWRGDDLVFTGTESMAGKQMASRHSITDISADAFHYIIEMGRTPAELKTVLTIEYTRAAN